MSDRPPGLACMPSWTKATPPWPGSWCRAPHGTRWWTERRGPKGWRCLTWHLPDGLLVEAIHSENELDDAPLPAAPSAPRQASSWTMRDDTHQYTGRREGEARLP